MVKKKHFLLFLIMVFILVSCKTNYTPKQPGYFRIDFPAERKYNEYSCDECPFTFEYPVIGAIQKDSTDLQEIHNHPCWFNIILPEYKAKIYLSYTSINVGNPLDKLIADSYKLTFKHTLKADYIDETPLSGKNPHVSGILYDVGGDAASGVQFYVTDSTKNFIRGSLYFFSPPNADSLAPCIQYFREDVLHLVETLKWR